LRFGSANMMKFPLLLVSFLFFSGLGAQQVTRDFPRLLWDEDFNQVNDKWPQTYNADNFFIIQNGNFELLRNNQKSGAFVLPLDERTFNFFDARTRIIFGDGPGKVPVAGLVLQAQGDGSGALVVEINNKGQYRIRRISREQSTNLSNGDGEGWVKAKKILNKTDNVINVKTYEKVYDLYINDKFVTTFTEIELSTGKVGLFVGPGTRISADYMQVRGDNNFLTVGGSSSETPEENLTFQQIIVKLRETINKKDKRIAELEAEVRRMGNLRSTGVDTFSARRVSELERLNTDLVKEIEKLRQENSNLRARADELDYFRNQVRESENGDIVINLTNVNLRQKQQIDKLESLRKVLESENSELRNEKLKLNQELERQKQQTLQRELEINRLKKQLHEKDSILRECNRGQGMKQQPDNTDLRQGNNTITPGAVPPAKQGLSESEIVRMQDAERKENDLNKQRGKMADKETRRRKENETVIIID